MCRKHSESVLLGAHTSGTATMEGMWEQIIQFVCFNWSREQQPMMAGRWWMAWSEWTGQNGIGLFYVRDSSGVRRCLGYGFGLNIDLDQVWGFSSSPSSIYQVPASRCPKVPSMSRHCTMEDVQWTADETRKGMNSWTNEWMLLTCRTFKTALYSFKIAGKLIPWIITVNLLCNAIATYPVEKVTITNDSLEEIFNLRVLTVVS